MVYIRNKTQFYVIYFFIYLTIRLYRDVIDPNKIDVEAKLANIALKELSKIEQTFYSHYFWIHKYPYLIYFRSWIVLNFSSNLDNYQKFSIENLYKSYFDYQSQSAKLYRKEIQQLTISHIILDSTFIVMCLRWLCIQ